MSERVFSKLKGFRDLVDEDAAYLRRLISVAEPILQRFSYNLIELPIVENTELYMKGVGATTDIIQKEMFSFKDGVKGNMVSLRPEGTAGVARAYHDNNLYQDNYLKKLYYIGAMFRRERPQYGRFRQFYQIGAEAIGSLSAALDAEVIQLFKTILDELLITEYNIEINSVGCPECRPSYKETLTNYFSKYKEELCKDCNSRLHTNPLRILDCKIEKCKAIVKDSPSILDNLCDSCHTHFSDLKRQLDLLNISYIVNDKIVRGLDYYIKTSFEFISTADKEKTASTICGGGRYDGLIGIYGKNNPPGVGFGAGIDRIINIMKTKQYSDIKFNRVDVFVIFFENTLKGGLEIVKNLRNKNILEQPLSIEYDYSLGSIKSQMKKAHKSKARFTIILGENELASSKVSIKDLKFGTQIEIELEANAIANYITGGLK